MLYVTFGPFDLETRQGRKGVTLDLRRDALARFWDIVEKTSQTDLRNALGVYVFAGKRKRKYVPWYVGQSKMGFEGEVFNTSNKNKYQSAYSHEMIADQAVIFLITKLTPRKESLAKTLPDEEANFVEHEVIRRALAANPSLINSSNTAFFRKWEIRGLINTVGDIKELDIGTKRLRNCLGITGEPDVYKTGDD